ncbi:two component, sigma54 specific, Fis family transcriptional regulator [Caballeronia arationis]|uniref:sigma 54-interacting transcriptional regulator n=1 Tax=Caballeronia arationis TaxID=1777142 RepID=UPI00074CF548|nr:sigma-54 dependent transcriptional regulator [Caballeronia arationis]SAL05079.1 two component, sigma54 specific, Fis family transcriptional regulator [Caballeronia arationis]
MIGRSLPFLRALALIQKFARCDASTLIEGETGTGKELAARATHYQGHRQAAPFLPVNCGALPDHLLENELFGHKRGAYTDARDDAPGLLWLANGGTIFLDEIDALSPKAQVMLLRVLQDQRYRPLGSKEEVIVDVRIIAASNRNLQSLVDCGQFRADLLFRINVLHLALPPLRERFGDPQLIAHDFVGRLAERYGRPVPRIEPYTLDWFNCYPWPGNVRELENLLHRELLLSDGVTLCFDAPAHPRSAAPLVAEPPHPPVHTFASPPNSQITTFAPYTQAKQVALKEFSESYLHGLMSCTRGNVSEAARSAGQERRAFSRLLKRYGISPQSFR